MIWKMSPFSSFVQLRGVFLLIFHLNQNNQIFPGWKKSVRNNELNINNNILKMVKVFYVTLMGRWGRQIPIFSIIKLFSGSNMFQKCLKYYLSWLSLYVSNLFFLKKYIDAFQGKSCKLRCYLAKWPNLHRKNLKNGQLEFLQPIFRNCLPNGFHWNNKLGQIY